MHNPNKEQIKAFKKVIEAIEEAKEKGLVFYGLQYNLVAYTEESDKYVKADLLKSLYKKGFASVPYLSSKVLADSGADDYPHYRTLEDEQKYLHDDL